MDDIDSNIPQDIDDSNWVREHRRIKFHKIWKCPHLYQMWRFLIMEAKYKDDVYSDGKIKIPLKRGQLVCSISYLQHWLGTSRSKTHFKLNSLRKLNAIQTKVEQGITVVTILNYDKYQCANFNPKTEVERTSNTNRTEFATQVDPSKELKNLRIKEFKKIKEVPVAPTPGSEIFKFYEEGFKAKFGRPPVRNAKVNSVAKKMAEQLGLEDAKKVITSFLQSQNQFYAQKGYPLELALNDAQAILLHEGKAPPPQSPQNRNYQSSGHVQGPYVPKVKNPTPEEIENLVDKNCPDCAGSGLRKEADEKGRQYRCSTCKSFWHRPLNRENHCEHPESIARMKQKFAQLRQNMTGRGS